MVKLTQAELKRYVISEILSAAHEISIPVIEMSPNDVDALRRKLAKKFGADSRHQIDFNNMSGKVSIQNEDGWRLLSEILEHDVHYMFYDHSCDYHGVEISNGARISDILERCFGFPFYVTDKENTFVIGMNDHDYLIGTGSVTDWLKKLKSELNQDKSP